MGWSSFPPFIILAIQASIIFSQTQSASKAPPLTEMRVLYAWKTADFVFPNASRRQDLIASGEFIEGNAIILDSDYWSKGDKEKVIVSLPLMKKGIPVTLATVSSQRAADGSPLLEPYPDWSWHGQKGCEGIISVFRTKVDECNRLWVIDSGVVEVLDKSNRICPPKLLVFDLQTDRLLLKHVYPESVLTANTLLVTVTVDIRDGKCDNAFAYAADVSGFSLLVFDARNKTSWKVGSNFFYPFPTHGSFYINGESFDLMDGILGLALSRVKGNGDRTLFFHSLSSVQEGWVSTSLLRNASNFENGGNNVPRKFFLSDEERSSQSAAEDMSSQNVLFFGLMNPPSIACWNTELPLTRSNYVTVANNYKTLQFASGLKIRKKAGQEEVFVTTSRFQTYILGTQNRTQYNYRILSASVKDLIQNTLCDPNLVPHKTIGLILPK